MNTKVRAIVTAAVLAVTLGAGVLIGTAVGGGDRVVHRDRVVYADRVQVRTPPSCLVAVHDSRRIFGVLYDAMGDVSSLLKGSISTDAFIARMGDRSRELDAIGPAGQSLNDCEAGR